MEIHAVSTGPGVLWINRENNANSWFFQTDERFRLIVVDSPAGSLVITIQARAELWDDSLPTAEEILAGISFPDL